MAQSYSIVYIYHIFFIHSSIDGHLGSFHGLAVVDIAAINIGVQVPLRIILFDTLDKYSVMQLLGCRVALFLTFRGISILSSRVAAAVCIPTNSVGGEGEDICKCLIR